LAVISSESPQELTAQLALIALSVILDLPAMYGIQLTAGWHDVRKWLKATRYMDTAPACSKIPFRIMCVWNSNSLLKNT